MDFPVHQGHGISEEELLSLLYGVLNLYVTFFNILCVVIMRFQNDGSSERRSESYRRYSLVRRIPRRVDHLHRLVRASDIECINQLRMSRDVFSRLCTLLQTSGGLCANRNSSIPEKVAIFLSILAHHTKVRIAKSAFNRSGRTVSRHFHDVLNALIRLHPLLLVKPVAIDDTCTSERWKSFKGCMGALDGTYVSVTVPKSQRGRYRNRKGEVSVNVLGVCDPNMNFIYVLCGWEGSAADSRVLRDALARPTGLRVPRGSYYLCDSGYANCEGFLTPYRGARYHLREWGVGTTAPQTREEYFNMKHSRARNVIERAFGVLKKRWAILRSTSFYPIKVQNGIIMACCLLHNFIRAMMVVDPFEEEVPDDFVSEGCGAAEFIDMVETSPMWTSWRDSLAEEMYSRWGN